MNMLQSLARAHLSTLPDCAAFLPALDGPPVAGGGAALAVGGAGHIAAHLPEAAPFAAERTRAITDAVIAGRDALDWWNAYADDDPAVGENYANRSAACQLCGVGDAGRAGFFFLREGVTYAPHAHGPDEIYAIIAGRARFWTVDGWREAGAGDVIHTPSWSWHGLKTDIGPLLILWAWIGAPLDDAPRFLRNDGTFPD